MTQLCRFALAAAFLLPTSCATLVEGTTDSVTFTSQPTNAKVLVDGVYVGKTPVTTELDKSENLNVIMQLDGYPDHYTQVERRFCGWTLGNLPLIFFFLSGVVGFIVDGVTGAVENISPTHYHIEFKK